jgi:hypothetical protein
VGLPNVPGVILQVPTRLSTLSMGNLSPPIRALLQDQKGPEDTKKKERKAVATAACSGDREIRRIYEQTPPPICSVTAILSWYPPSTCPITLYGSVGYNEAFGLLSLTGPSAQALPTGIRPLFLPFGESDARAFQLLPLVMVSAIVPVSYRYPGSMQYTL